MSLKGLNKLAKQINSDNVKKGFYDEEREIGTLLMLCVSELSEALEADRKDRYADIDVFKEALIEDGQSFKDSFHCAIKDTFEDEIADTMIRLFDLCGYLNIDIEQHIDLKLEYNRQRGYKHGKNY